MHISNKLSVAVHCLIFTHEYGQENKVTSELLARSTGCNPVTVRTILSALKKEGILEVRAGTGGTTLALPLREITLDRICMAVDPEAVDRMIGVHSSPSPFCPVGRNIEETLERTYSILRENFMASMRSVTLEKIVNDYHAVAEKEKKS